MKTLACLAGLFPVLALAVPSQEPPAPAAQLEKLQPIVGTWQLSGTMKESPDGPELPWTAQHTARWVLGGHFLREEVRITPGGGDMPDIAFSSFTGWDAENQKFIVYGAGNMGGVSSSELVFTGPDTMVSSGINQVGGQQMIERAVVRLSGDRYSLEIQQAAGDGPFFTSVAGQGRRTSGEGRALAVEAAASFAPVAPEMSIFEGMAGEYAVKGTMIPIPGAPETEISGTEVISLILGGNVMQNVVTGEAAGDPNQYESYGYTAWNPADRCFDMLSVDNMGMAAKAQLRKVGDRTMVGTMSGMMMGQPMVGRSIMKLDGRGQISSVTMDMISGTGAPERTFSATYTRR